MRLRGTFVRGAIWVTKSSSSDSMPQAWSSKSPLDLLVAAAADRVELCIGEVARMGCQQHCWADGRPRPCRSPCWDGADTARRCPFDWQRWWCCRCGLRTMVKVNARRSNGASKRKEPTSLGSSKSASKTTRPCTIDAVCPQANEQQFIMQYARWTDMKAATAGKLL